MQPFAVKAPARARTRTSIVSCVTPEEAIDFVAENHRAVLVTRRRDGALQTSPVTVGIDGENHIVMSSRETAYKVRNLQRDPSATLCIFTDAFFGAWIQVEARTDIVALPEAMELLVDYYRRIRGEHPDWDDYRRVMREEQRVMVRFSIESVGPQRSG